MISNLKIYSSQMTKQVQEMDNKVKELDEKIKKAYGVPEL